MKILKYDRQLKLMNEEISSLRRAINQLETKRNLSKIEKSVCEKFKKRLRKMINIKKHYSLQSKKVMQWLKSGERGSYTRIDRGGLTGDDKRLSGRY